MTDLYSQTPLDKALRELIKRALGSGCKVLDRSRVSGRKSTTWKLTAADGANFYLKRHEHHRHYSSELLALSEWAPRLAMGDWWSTPSVVARDDELGALIITELPGVLFSEVEMAAEERAEVYRLAGRLAAMIHALAVDPHEAGNAQIYDRDMILRFRAFATPYLAAEILAWFEDICTADEAFNSLPLLPTHSDYSPRNWVINRDADGVRLGLIDWERARPGYWLEDAQRMVCDHWRREPALRSAFYEGYGRFPSRCEERQVKLIALVNAVGAIPWAHEHNDAEFASIGHQAIAWLRLQLAE